MHYIIGLVHDGAITLLYCASSERVADIFTKVFSENNFSNLKSLLGIANHVVNIDRTQDFIHFCSCPCLREDFPLCVFYSFCVLYGQAVCKGWLSLVAKAYLFDIFLILYINSGLIGGVGIIKTHPKTWDKLINLFD